MRICDLLESITEGKSWSSMPVEVAYNMLAAYNDIAPHVRQFHDDEGSDRLYSVLQSIARDNNIGQEFKSLMSSAQGGAHMEFDTNPGHFKNWFPFVGELLQSFVERNKDSEEGGIEIGQGN
jgi:hypothetical protein